MYSRDKLDSLFLGSFLVHFGMGAGFFVWSRLMCIVGSDDSIVGSDDPASAENPGKINNSRQNV